LRDPPPDNGTTGPANTHNARVQHRLTADDQTELLNRYLAGEWAYQLARAFEIDRRTVATLLKSTGLRRQRRCVLLRPRGSATLG
jgi:hypothetical protein